MPSSSPVAASRTPLPPPGPQPAEIKPDDAPSMPALVVESTEISQARDVEERELVGLEREGEGEGGRTAAAPVDHPLPSPPRSSHSPESASSSSTTHQRGRPTPRPSASASSPHTPDTALPSPPHSSTSSPGSAGALSLSDSPPRQHRPDPPSISSVPSSSILAPRPDPLIDITRLRIPSSGRGCLQPGAQFRGTQRSGRSSYDVEVTIIDVSLLHSSLSGYLRIRGLTQSHPDLTTFFSADLIGAEHGFVTDKWGASEADDIKHWQRFPAFRQLKPELRRPGLTYNPGKGWDRRETIFMRWKEQFMVPDYTVRDIAGASFAGFYYACIDLSSPPAPPRASSPHPSSYPSRARSPSIPPSRPTSTSTSVPSLAPWDPPPESGPHIQAFYFHQSSEPYQELSLRYVPSAAIESFEFR